MQWTVHGRRSIYESAWVSLDLVDVELPDGQRFEQHVVRMARPVAGAAVIRDPGQAPGPSVRGARADPLSALCAGKGVRGKGQGHGSCDAAGCRSTKWRSESCNGRSTDAGPSMKAPG